MRETRVALTELIPGEMVLRLGTREVNARFVALHPVTAGMGLSGPRGGRYVVRQPGDRVIVETYKGRPVVSSTTTATVLRNAPEED